MPMLTIEVIEGRTVEQKRALAKDITDAVVRHLKVPLEAVTIVIHDLPKYNVASSGKLKADS